MIWQTKGLSEPAIICESPTENIKLIISDWQYRHGNDWTITRTNDNSQFWIEFHSYQKGSPPLHVKVEISEESFMAWYSLFNFTKVKTFTATPAEMQAVRKRFLPDPHTSHV